MRYLLVFLAVVWPFSYNIIDYNKNTFANIFIPLLAKEETEEISFNFNAERNKEVEINIYIDDFRYLYPVYNKNFFTIFEEVIKDTFVLEGYLVQKDVLFIFEAIVEGRTYTKNIEYPYYQIDNYKVDEDILINGPVLNCLSDRGTASKIYEEIEIKRNVVDNFIRIPLDICTIFYKNSWNLDLRYKEAYLEIIDINDIFSHITKVDKKILIPLDFSLSDDIVVKHFRNNLYYDEETLVMYSNYQQGLKSIDDGLFLPIGKKIEYGRLEIKIIIEHLGYTSGNFEINYNSYFSQNIGGICLKSEVCVYRV